MITPDSRHVGDYAMVSLSYPGRMKIGGRLVELQSILTRADGTCQFACRLLDDSSPHGDRYPLLPVLDVRWLELCNISDAKAIGDSRGDWHCYNHGWHKDPEGKAKWHLPTPPRFKSVEEAEEWMAQHEENVRVRSAIRDLGSEVHQRAEEYVDQWGIKHFPPAEAFDPDVTPDWDGTAKSASAVTDKAIFDVLQEAIANADGTKPWEREPVTPSWPEHWSYQQLADGRTVVPGHPIYDPKTGREIGRSIPPPEDLPF